MRPIIVLLALLSVAFVPIAGAQDYVIKASGAKVE